MSYRLHPNTRHTSEIIQTVIFLWAKACNWETSVPELLCSLFLFPRGFLLKVPTLVTWTVFRYLLLIYTYFFFNPKLYCFKKICLPKSIQSCSLFIPNYKNSTKPNTNWWWSAPNWSKSPRIAPNDLHPMSEVPHMSTVG